MTCFHPLRGYKARPGLGRAFTLSTKDGYPDFPMIVPCGQCIGCRLERSRQWAVRCVHEASCHDENSFITLTYSSEHLPEFGSLRKRDVQLFLKKLRKWSYKNFDRGFRYYYCGEYGEGFGRPHYHLCIFGLGFPDRYLWRKTQNGCLVYRSPSLEKLWTLGQSEIGSVTFESAAYTARYIMKKRLGKDASSYYDFVDDNGEVHERLPEFTDMSRRPGIGFDWYSRWCDDVYPSGYLVVNGVKCRPPRYYDLLLEADCDKEFRRQKAARKRAARKRASDNTPERLRVREQVTEARVSLLKREMK